MYEEGVMKDEPDGYHEHPELHAWGWKLDKPEWSRADKDALWRRITDKTRTKAFRDQWGIRPSSANTKGRSSASWSASSTATSLRRTTNMR